jgi:hypothetical protein
MSQPRKAKYKRHSEVTLKLNERDSFIIEAIYRHRFLNTDQVAALIGGSKQMVVRRLNKLFHSGYIDRPAAQLSLMGNRPMIYALGNKGAQLLCQHWDLPADELDWTSKNREVKGMFLEHSLMVSQFMVCMELACKKIKEVRFIPPEEIINRRPLPGVGIEKTLGWKVNSKVNNKLYSFSIIPDGAFGIEVSEPKGTYYFFLEADRSTMPVQRSNLFRSSFLKKMIGYFSTWQQDLYSKHFGFKNVRVLTVALSQERINSLVAANKSIDPKGIGLRMFLFTKEEYLNLAHPEILFTQAWTNGFNETVTLI